METWTHGNDSSSAENNVLTNLQFLQDLSLTSLSDVPQMEQHLHSMHCHRYLRTEMIMLGVNCRQVGCPASSKTHCIIAIQTAVRIWWQEPGQGSKTSSLHEHDEYGAHSKLAESFLHGNKSYRFLQSTLNVLLFLLLRNLQACQCYPPTPIPT